jgi:polysaccharide export outer membrane protein
MFKISYAARKIQSTGQVLLFVLLSLSSCTTQKQLIYLQGVDQDGKENFYPEKLPEYKLQKQDILYVKFSTVNEEINNVLNIGNTQGNQNMILTESGAYLAGYTVNDSGNIDLPLIGKIQVEGKTLEDTRKDIENHANRYLKDATVVVRLLSFKFTVLGEVNTPGTFHNYNNQLNVLDAIGLAGDITSIGDRSRVLIVRSQNGGSRTFRINLLRKDLLTSEGYFLLPNDIVIVEPLRVKFLQLNAPTISLLVSTTVSTLSLTLLIISLF